MKVSLLLLFIQIEIIKHWQIVFLYERKITIVPCICYSLFFILKKWPFYFYNNVSICHNLLQNTCCILFSLIFIMRLSVCYKQPKLLQLLIANLLNPRWVAIWCASLVTTLFASISKFLLYVMFVILHHFFLILDVYNLTKIISAFLYLYSLCIYV